jgi:hypothetical protein
MSFLNLILHSIVGHGMYSFMDNYNGYNQVKMVEDDKVKLTFILEWGMNYHLVYAMFLPHFKK